MTYTKMQSDIRKNKAFVMLTKIQQLQQKRTIVQNFATMELRFTMENYGSMKKP